MPTPLASAEASLAALVAEQVQRAAPNPAPRARPTHTCHVGAGYYPERAQRVPTLRLRGHWLAQLGFDIGSKLRITARDGELIVRVEDSEPATEG